MDGTSTSASVTETDSAKEHFQKVHQNSKIHAFASKNS